MRKTEIRDLPVPLLPDEIQSFRSELLAGLDKIDELQAQIDDVKAKAKARAKELEGSIEERALRLRHVRGCLATKTEDRPVECYETPFWQEGIVRVYRTDTDALVGTRPIKPSERQLHLKDLDRRAETKRQAESADSREDLARSLVEALSSRNVTQACAFVDATAGKGETLAQRHRVCDLLEAAEVAGKDRKGVKDEIERVREQLGPKPEGEGEAAPALVAVKGGKSE